MNGGFAFRAAAVCVVAGAVAAVVAAPAGPAAVRWVLAGWAATAAAGYCGGTRMVALRGRVGPGFLVALGTSMLVRLAAAAIGTAAAAWAGPAAVGVWLRWGKTSSEVPPVGKRSAVVSDRSGVGPRGLNAGSGPGVCPNSRATPRPVWVIWRPPSPGLSPTMGMRG